MPGESLVQIPARYLRPGDPIFDDPIAFRLYVMLLSLAGSGSATPWISRRYIERSLKCGNSQPRTAIKKLTREGRISVLKVSKLGTSYAVFGATQCSAEKVEQKLCQPTNQPSNRPSNQPTDRPTRKMRDTATSMQMDIASINSKEKVYENGHATLSQDVGFKKEDSQPTNQPTNQPTDRPTNRPTGDFFHSAHIGYKNHTDLQRVQASTPEVQASTPKANTKNKKKTRSAGARSACATLCRDALAEIEVPTNLAESEDFMAVLDEWFEYREEQGYSPYKKIGLRNELAARSKDKPSVAAEGYKFAMSRGWIGWRLPEPSAKRQGYQGPSKGLPLMVIPQA